MRKFRIAALTAATVMLTVGLAGSTPASAACNPSRTVLPGDDATLDKIEAGDETIYIDRRTGTGEVWIYRETNGIAGLQRGGSHAYFGPLADTDECNDQHPAGPDELIY
jgi:hypothetical protein